MCSPKGRVVVFLALFHLSVGAVFAPSDNPIGTDRFSTHTLDFAGRAFEIFPLDMDEDGLQDIVVVHLDDEQEQPLRLLTVFPHLAGKGFSPEKRFVLPIAPDAVAITLGNWDGKRGIDVGLIAPKGVFSHSFIGADGAASQPATTAAVNSTALPRAAAFAPQATPLIEKPGFLDLPQHDVVFVWIGPEDIDGNGLHDLVLPRTDGYTIFFQTEPGSFGRTCDLEVPQQNQVADSPFAFLSFERRLPRLVLQDFNGDFRKDVLFCYDDSFVCHLQEDSGQFPSAPSLKFSSRFMVDAEKMNRIEVSMITLDDLNGDKVPEMIVTRTRGEIGVFESIATDIYVLYGKAGAAYQAVPDQIIKVRGVSIYPQFIDINRDGFKDIIVSCFRTDLISVGVSAAIDSFTFTYYVYTFDGPTGMLTDVPAYDVAVSISREMLEKGGRNLPLVSFSGDFDGDGRNDMLTTSGDGVLSIYRGKRAVGMVHRSEIGFEKGEYLRLKLEAPKWIDILDMNKDGKSDILLQYGSRAAVLLSK
jgi:hypothetical protein